MSNKNIIIFTAILFFISAFILSYIEKRLSDENFQKNWWVVYFENPADTSLNFTIENHSDKNNFHWEILADNQKINEGDISINKGSAWTSDTQTAGLEGKTTISVSNGADKKDIYKNFEKK